MTFMFIVVLPFHWLKHENLIIFFKVTFLVILLCFNNTNNNNLMKVNTFMEVEALSCSAQTLGRKLELNKSKSSLGFEGLHFGEVEWWLASQ